RSNHAIVRKACNFIFGSSALEGAFSVPSADEHLHPVFSNAIARGRGYTNTACGGLTTLLVSARTSPYLLPQRHRGTESNQLTSNSPLIVRSIKSSKDGAISATTLMRSLIRISS